MPFNRPAPAQQTAPTPEQLFGVLPRTGSGHTTLWVHQGDVLRTYYDSYRDRPDVAIELPTGTGKTLPGLLIADWNRRERTERVAFACPTAQLVKQVVRSAKRQNVPVVDLSGSWRDWDQSDRLRFERAQAIAIVTYSSIFNSSPHLQDLGTIVFDDAHAGEQYVAGAYALDIDRRSEPELYETIRARLTPSLPPGVGARLHEDPSDPVVWNGVHLILPGAHDDLAGHIETDIANAVDPYSSLGFKLSMIRGRIDACQIYVSWRRISIRPFIPPTFENSVYLGARQRIYLSATLGDSGEIERAFGREHVSRLPLPTSAGIPRSGRRFFVFPSLVRNTNPAELTRALIERAGRGIVLAPSAQRVNSALSHLVPEGWTVFQRDRVESGFDDFAATPKAVSIIANRYDGIDLPEDACRCVVLYGHPRATHLQEEFLASRARAVSAFSERIRSRVVQGSGRCTRGPEDYALVVVGDNDTATYLARPDVLKSFDPALQAEIEFGFANSEVTREQLLENVDHFLAQDSEWQVEAEPHIAELQNGLVRSVTSGAIALASSAPHEVRASELAWQGAWTEAAVSANSACQELSGVDEVRAYRAFWLLQSAYFANLSARQGLGSSIDFSEAQAKLALAAAQPQTWIREVLPLPGLEALPPSVEDLAAAHRIAAQLTRPSFNVARNTAALQAIVDDLTKSSPSAFEPALTRLGVMLGADAFKPDAQGNCDSAWCWENHMWLTIEAKSDESPDSAVSIDTVRQTNSQLAMLAAERAGAAIPFPTAASIIASPRTAIDKGAVIAAQAHVHLVHVDDFVTLAQDVLGLWAELHPLRNAESTSVPQLVLDVMRRWSLTPSDVFQRLTTQPVSSD